MAGTTVGELRSFFISGDKGPLSFNRQLAIEELKKAATDESQGSQEDLLKQNELQRGLSQNKIRTAQVA